MFVKLESNSLQFPEILFAHCNVVLSVVGSGRDLFFSVWAAWKRKLCLFRHSPAAVSIAAIFCILKWSFQNCQTSGLVKIT